MSAEINIDMDYQGYTYMGHAQGNMEDEKTHEKRPYFQMFVLSPVSSYKSENYCASGLKAEKKRCVSPDVWDGLEPGCQVKLFFDDKKRVVMAALDN